MSDKKLPDYFEFYAAPAGEGSRYAMTKAAETQWVCHEPNKPLQDARYNADYIVRQLADGTWRFADEYNYLEDLPPLPGKVFDFHCGNPMFLYRATVNGPVVDVTWNHFGGEGVNRTAYNLDRVQKNLASGAWFVHAATKSAAQRVVELVKEDLKDKPVERSFDRRLELKLEDGYYRAYDDDCQAMADAKYDYDNAIREVKSYEGFLQKKKDALEEARKALERFKVT